MNLEQGPWKSEKWWVSHLNFDPLVVREVHIPKSVKIHDVTLRDGEQTPGVVFRKDEKIQIARKLDEVGVHRIEAGMPVVSDEDLQAVKAIAHAGLSAEIVAFCRLVREDVDAALKCDVPRIICEGPVGYPKLKQFGWSEEEVSRKALDVLEYAKSHGLKVTFFGVDSTRADVAFLLKLFREVVGKAKVDGVAVVDTFGCITPEALRMLIGKVRQAVPVPVEAHCHDDVGLGTANAIAAATAGAEVIHASVGGLAERTGNAVLEEVTVALQLLYGVDLGFRLEKLMELSKMVQRFAGMEFQSNRPVIGDRAFTREAGISVAGWIKYHLGSEAFLPEVVGNKHGIVLGKKSGKHSIEYKLQEMGLAATPEQVVEILERVKKRSEEKKSEVSQEEFRGILREILRVPVPS